MRLSTLPRYACNDAEVNTMPTPVDEGMYGQGLDPSIANYTPLSPLSFLARTADVYPQHPSVIHAGRTYTWGETYARCVRLASAIRNAVTDCSYSTPLLLCC